MDTTKYFPGASRERFHRVDDARVVRAGSPQLSAERTGVQAHEQHEREDEGQVREQAEDATDQTGDEACQTAEIERVEHRLDLIGAHAGAGECLVDAVEQVEKCILVLRHQAREPGTGDDERPRQQDDADVDGKDRRERPEPPRQTTPHQHVADRHSGDREHEGKEHRPHDVGDAAYTGHDNDRRGESHEDENTPREPLHQPDVVHQAVLPARAPAHQVSLGTTECGCLD